MKELAKQLKKKLESGEIEVSEKNDNVTEKVVVLMRTDASGLERPVWSKVIILLKVILFALGNVYCN